MNTTTHNAKTTKLSQVRDAMAKENWRLAIRIASKFRDLGTQRGAILDAQIAFTNPRFLVEIKRDVDVCIEEGILALRDRFGE